MTFLGPPLSDGYDEFSWIAAQPWSNGKVGTIGCSSTAEWQLAVAARAIRRTRRFIPQGFGAGVGRVGPYYEQGNWYRGGAVQMLFIAWLYGEQNQVRPMFPPNYLAGGSDPRIEGIRPCAALCRRWTGRRRCGTCRKWTSSRLWMDRMEFSPITCPVSTTGGAMIERAPNDPAWYKGGLWHDNMKINVPGFWFMSWYDVSMGPNLAAYNLRAQNGAAGNRQPAVRSDRADAALWLCKRATENTVVGEREWATRDWI